MNSGLYAACAGLRAKTQALDVLANNLANISTSGFKAEQPVFRSVLAQATQTVLTPINAAINNYGVLGGARLDLSSGNLEHTGSLFDMGIEGNAFFAVQTPGGVLYTRNGGFQLSAKNQLVTARGDIVLGEQGPITLPRGKLSVSPDGTLSVEGALAGKLRLVEFASGAQLNSVGSGYYSAESSSAGRAVLSYVRQGTLEAANVTPVGATVSLIALQRQAEMLKRALGSFYSEFNRIAAEDLPRI
ncbi:MAG TPA: flagellar hook basal-body protein [Candidatus Sulfotelmatobacter sp.]|nr:flagellar hook basal-body protein [Candidatus Sulfotelmatobacter sp.]